MLGRPGVVEVVGALADARAGIEVEGEEMRVPAAGPGLGEGAERVGRMIVEAPHPRVAAVVVIEGAVLLHEEDDVLHGPQVRAGGPD